MLQCRIDKLSNISSVTFPKQLQIDSICFLVAGEKSNMNQVSHILATCYSTNPGHPTIAYPVILLIPAVTYLCHYTTNPSRYSGAYLQLLFH